MERPSLEDADRALAEMTVHLSQLATQANEALNVVDDIQSTLAKAIQLIDKLDEKESSE